jgi:SAM-dependent methyltransferase
MLNELRREEFNRIRKFINPGDQVLEVGGGTGYQARLINAMGVRVDSIDVASPPEASETYYPVGLYNGRDIPFPDGRFEVVFSSNVLEHVSHLPDLLSEMRRVLKDGGLAIHVLPTPTWRLWTSLARYPHLARRAAQVGARRTVAIAKAVESPEGPPSFWRRLRRLLWDGPHGEYPTAVSELWYFSQRRWERVFRENGFDLLEAEPAHLFYTGYTILPGMNLATRRKLATVLGSSTRCFVMRKH